VAAASCPQESALPRIADLPTAEARREATEPARRESRFRYARTRVRQIVAAWPPLTPEQKAELAVILLTGEGGGDAA
jgi:hypothetical protein